MAHHDDQIAGEVELEDAEERLDPEQQARRAAALRLIRKHGDPALRSRARAVDVFDERLVDEVRRMGQIMHDAYGIGLAAARGEGPPAGRVRRPPRPPARTRAATLAAAGRRDRPGARARARPARA